MRNETKKEIVKILDKDEYEFYGLRVVPSGQPVRIGKILKRSWIWEDNNYTNKRLPGACVIGIGNWMTFKEEADLIKAYNRLLDGRYPEGTIVLCGSDEAKNGQEPQELVMVNAKVLAII